MRYSKSCGYYRDFLERELLQTKGSKQFKLKSSLRKLYGRHHDFAIVTEYPCHKWPRICSVCRNQNPVFYSIVSHYRVCNKSNMTGVTCGAGKAYHSASPEFISVFSVVRFVQSLVFYAYHCLSLCTFLSAIVLSFSWFTTSGYLFHIIKSLFYPSCNSY
jgi:hypothetical protein